MVLNTNKEHLDVPANTNQKVPQKNLYPLLTQKSFPKIRKQISIIVLITKEKSRKYQLTLH